MKYLKTFENSEFDIQTVENLLIDLKDEYPYIDISSEIYKDNSGMAIYINFESIYSDNMSYLDRYEVKTKFTLLLVQICKRIKSSMNFLDPVILFQEGTKVNSVQIMFGAKNVRSRLLRGKTRSSGPK